jgi:hypothetical protein
MLWYRHALAAFAALCALLVVDVWINWPTSIRAVALLVGLWFLASLVSVVVELIALPRGEPARPPVVWASRALRAVVAICAAWVVWGFVRTVIDGHAG